MWLLLAIFCFVSPGFGRDLSVISPPSEKVTVHRDGPLTLGVVARSQVGQELRYEWSKNGKLLAQETANSLRIQRATAKDAGHYSVKVMSGEESQTFHSHVTFDPKRLPKSAPPRQPAATTPAADAGHCGH